MIDSELKKYAQLIAAMSCDFLSGGITSKTFTANLAIIADQINPQRELEVRESVLLQEAIELESGAVLTPRSVKAAWAGRMRGKAGKIRDKINSMRNQ